MFQLVLLQNWEDPGSGMSYAVRCNGSSLTSREVLRLALNRDLDFPRVPPGFLVFWHWYIVRPGDLFETTEFDSNTKTRRSAKFVVPEGGLVEPPQTPGPLFYKIDDYLRRHCQLS